MKTKRLLSLLLALCMAVSFLHVGVLAEDEPADWESLQELLNGTEETVTLTQDYTATADDRNLEVPEGRTATLDLNGYKIDGSALETEDVLTVYGTLTLTDLAGGGNLAADGGNDAVYVDRGSFTVTGGTISAENVEYGAVYVGEGSSFTVSGAPAIGSVYLESGAVITVGGELTRKTPLPVKTADTPTDKAVIITSHLSEGGSEEQFISVNTDYAVYMNKYGEAELRPSQTDESIIVSNNNPVTLGNTYAFTPLDNGAYVFYSVGDMDTVGTLYLGEDEIANDDNSGEGNNFRISAFLNAESMYRLCVRGKSDDDNGETCTVVVKYLPPLAFIDGDGTEQLCEDYVLLTQAISAAAASGSGRPAGTRSRGRLTRSASRSARDRTRARRSMAPRWRYTPPSWRTILSPSPSPSSTVPRSTT